MEFHCKVTNALIHTAVQCIGGDTPAAAAGYSSSETRVFREWLTRMKRHRACLSWIEKHAILMECQNRGLRGGTKKVYEAISRTNSTLRLKQKPSYKAIMRIIKNEALITHYVNNDGCRCKKLWCEKNRALETRNPGKSTASPVCLISSFRHYSKTNATLRTINEILRLFFSLLCDDQIQRPFRFNRTLLVSWYPIFLCNQHCHNFAPAVKANLRLSEILFIFGSVQCAQLIHRIVLLYPKLRCRNSSARTLVNFFCSTLCED